MPRRPLDVPVFNPSPLGLASQRRPRMASALLLPPLLPPLLSLSLSLLLPLPLLLAAAFLVPVLTPAPAHAGGFHISIVGVRRTGMMTNLANPDDGTALFHNPAGLADQHGTRLHLSSGMTFLKTHVAVQALDPKRFPEINADPCGGPEEPACDWPIRDGYYVGEITPERYLGVIPYLGISQDLGVVSPGLRDVVVSVATYAPGAYGAFLPEDAPTAYYVTEGLFIVAAATAGVGWRLSQRLSLGASVSYNYMRLGYGQKLALADVLTEPGEEVDAIAYAAQYAYGDLQMDYGGQDHGMGWGVGALVTLTSWWSLGLGYQGATAPHFRGDVSIRSLGSRLSGEPGRSADNLRGEFTKLGYTLPTELEVEMPIPPAFAVGTSVHPTDWLELGLDFRLWLYSIYDKQSIRPIYPDGDGKQPMTEESLSHDKHYSNSYEVALGVLVRPFSRWPGLELMGGVAYDRSPVPDETFSIDNPSMNQAIVSAGVRAGLGERWKVGLAYMMINYLERDITTSTSSPPVNVRIRGTSHIPTLEVEALF